MIKLELRNTKTQKSVFVDTRGAVFGREGGDADVKIADQGVSKKHARIYTRKGEWFLEDLNSANGTYVEGQRISQAVLLEPGAMFTLSRQQFEVVQFVEDEPEVTQAPRQDMLPSDDSGDADAPSEEYDASGEDEPAEDEEFQETVPPNSPPSRRPEPRGAPAQASPRSRGASAEEAPRRPAGPARSAARARPQSIEADEAPAGFDVGYFLKAVPKAIAYYAAAIPLMLVNPVGFIRRGVEEQKVPAMGTLQLIAYAFPALLAQALLVFLGSLLGQISAGAVSLGSIIPLGALIGAVLGAVISGFLWHPVLNWIVTKLGGDSDARSRSNMFVASMAATALFGVPALLVGIVSFIPVTLLALVPILVQAAVSLIVFLVYYSWFKHFDVMRWFQYGVLALAGLTLLGVVGSSVSVISASLSGVGSGGGVEMASSDGEAGSEEIPPEWKSALEAAEASGNAEMVANVRAQMKDAMARMKAAAEAQQAAQAQQDDAQKANAENTGAMAAKADDAKLGAASASGTVEAASAKNDTKLEMPPPPQPAMTVTASVKVAPVRGMPYPEYRKKLTAIEGAISDDPTLLKRVDGLLPLYENLYKARYQAEEKIRNAQKKSDRWQAPVNAHLRDAEVYKETQELVGRVHAKMFP